MFERATTCEGSTRSHHITVGSYHRDAATKAIRNANPNRAATYPPCVCDKPPPRVHDRQPAAATMRNDYTNARAPGRTRPKHGYTNMSDNCRAARRPAAAADHRTRVLQITRVRNCTRANRTVCVDDRQNTHSNSYTNMSDNRRVSWKWNGNC